MPEAQNAGGAATAKPAPRIARLERSPAGYGLVVDFLSGVEPFSRFEFGNFAAALRYQVLQGCNVAAFLGPRLVGYFGWLPTTPEIAAAWVATGGPLMPKEGGAAIAVTIVTARERAFLTPLVAEVRRINRGRRFYFKRDYPGGRRPARTASVADIH